jgi:8-oxo-dGTP pyrophosphatase MutT (NUDIX family)
MRAHEFTDQGAAGIVLYAEDTGRYGLQQRSDDINDPGMWAAWGGGRGPGESLEQCATRELGEEGGYTGPIKLKRIGENSKYVTFLGIIPSEFEPRENPEWQDYCWVEAGDWPSPMHPGVAVALKNIPVKASVDEAFDQPYKSKWETSEYGDVDASTKLPDGTYLNIMFNQEYDGEGEEVIQVEFHRNNSQEVTGEGDAQRIFATVLGAIQKYIKKYKPPQITFSASKEVEPGQNSESRAKLYNRLVDRYAASWGYDTRTFEHGNAVTYELTQYPSSGPFESTFTENFADGKVKGKSRPGRVKRAGASCDGSVTDLRQRAKNASGEKARMYHWCANMKSGKAK